MCTKQNYYSNILNNLEIALSSKDQAACLREYNAVMKNNHSLYDVLQESTTINEQKKLQDEEMRVLMYCDDASSLDEEVFFLTKTKTKTQSSSQR